MCYHLRLNNRNLFYVLRFRVNKRIFVVGFGLYGSIHGPADYSVKIEIIHSDSGEVLGQNDTAFSCNGSDSTFRVMFKNPVEVGPNMDYIASATLKVRFYREDLSIGQFILSTSYSSFK